MGEVTIKGGATEVVGAVVGAVASSELSITSMMWLRVELSTFEIIMGFRLSVLLFDACSELGGFIPLIDLVSCLRFHCWPPVLRLLLASLPVVIECAEPIETSCC